MDLLIVGSVAYDSIITPFGKANKTLGGSATYFSLAASFYTHPGIVAVVGNDFKARDKKLLAGRKINISGLQKSQGQTFRWAGKYNFDLSSRQTLKTELGVFADFKPILSAEQKKSSYVFLGNIHPKLQMDVLRQIERPKFVGLDTMNYWIESALPDLKKVLRQVGILIINDGEARQLSDEHNLLKAAKKILGMMRSTRNSQLATLIIKQGEHGLLMFQPAVSLRVQPKQSDKKINDGNRLRIFNLPGFPLEDVADPTGAGDTFAGGFMGYLAKTDDTSWANLKRACLHGSVLASFCVEKLGTERLLDIGILDIKKRLKDFEGLTEIK